MDAVEKCQLTFGIAEVEVEEDFTGPAVILRRFEASYIWHLYFELLVLGLLRLDHDVHVLNFPLSGISLVFLLLVLFNFPLVGYDKLPPADGEVGILDSFMILLGGEVHESLDVLRVVYKSDRNHSFLDHFPLNSIHIPIILTIMNH